MKSKRYNISSLKTAATVAVIVLAMLFPSACYGQDRYQLNSAEVPYIQYGARYNSYNPYMSPPSLYSGGKYLGELSNDRYAPNSVSNPYGRYGNRYSPDSINNPYGNYGRYSTQPIWVYQRRFR